MSTSEFEQVNFMGPDLALTNNNAYVLNDPTVNDLLRYVWTAANLPQDKATYLIRISATSLDPLVEPQIIRLLDVYKTIVATSTVFRDTTYPSIVQIAHNLYSYASIAGGTLTTSFYARLITTTKDLAVLLAKNPKTQADQDDITKKRGTINTLVTNRVNSINNFKAQASQVKTDLQTYQNTCNGHKSSLMDVKTSIDTQILGASGTGGTINALNTRITELTAQLDSYQAEWKSFTIAAGTSPVWLAIPIFGLFIAPAVGIGTGAKAGLIAEAMSNIRTEIASKQATVQRDYSIVADLNRMKLDVQRILDLLGPAITAIGRMITGWQGMATQLQSIGELANDPSINSDDLIDLTQQGVIDSWNELKVKVDQYRQNAYVVVEPATLASATDAYRARAAM